MAASRLFEQLQKAAVARAKLAQPPVASAQATASDNLATLANVVPLLARDGSEAIAREVAEWQAQSDAANASTRMNTAIAEQAAEAIRVAVECERADREARLAAEKLLEAERQAETALWQRVQAERRAEEAARARLEVERIAAEQSQRLAELEREEREARQARHEALPPIAQAPASAVSLARGIAAAVVVAALVLAWFFVPWRTPLEPSTAKPTSLKMDPKLDLARPK